MTFRPRNPYYLRISKKDVLPVYLYLDDRHLEWMSDPILQHVLEDLRPKILPKLQTEADANLGPGGPPSAKKTTVETHRGETYQFCYFLRRTQPHSVVLKTRAYAAVPGVKKSMMPPPPIPAKTMKRKSKQGDKETSRKKPKTKGKGRAVENSESEESISSGEDDEIEFVSGSRTSLRTRKLATEVDRDGDTPMEDGDISADDDGDDYIPTSRKKKGKERVTIVEFSMEILDEEEKPKPVLHLHYQGFKILGSCLCIVVEPWPPVRAPSRAPSVLKSPSRAPSIAPRDFTISETGFQSRSKTPLFLPDPDEQDRSETPFPDAMHIRPLPVPLNEVDSNTGDVDYGGMMEFSQALNSVGDVRAGAVDDDEDMEGAVFFGDADEVREL